MMKRFVTVLLVLALALSMTACGSKKPSAEEPKTPAGAFIAGFSEKAQAGKYASLEELGTQLAEAALVPVDLAVMQVQPGYLNGFSGEVTGFNDGVMVAPWIGSIPFVAYIFTPEAGTKAETLINTLKEQADLNWNICTSADEMAYAEESGVVCFVMAPASFEN